MAGIALFANPDSGHGDATDAVALLRRRSDLTTFALDQPERAVESAPDRIVVAGGDGSIAVAAAVAARVQAPLAVIPVGTANDFARALGLPSDPTAASELALHGTRTRRLELGSIDGRPFVNAASAGLSPVAARKAQGLKRTLGPIAYAAGAIRAGISARPIACRVRCDERLVFEGRAWQVTAGVTGAFGGGAGIEAEPSDGELDVVVIEAGSRARLLVHAYGLRAGGIAGQRGAYRARGRVIEIDTDATGFNVDGELVDARRARLTVEPSAYEVVVG